MEKSIRDDFCKIHHKTIENFEEFFDTIRKVDKQRLKEAIMNPYLDYNFHKLDTHPYYADIVKQLMDEDEKVYMKIRKMYLHGKYVCNLVGPNEDSYKTVKDKHHNKEDTEKIKWLINENAQLKKQIDELQFKLKRCQESSNLISFTQRLPDNVDIRPDYVMRDINDKTNERIKRAHEYGCWDDDDDDYWEEEEEKRRQRLREIDEFRKRQEEIMEQTMDRRRRDIIWDNKY